MQCTFSEDSEYVASTCMASKKGEVHLPEENDESSEESILKVEENSTVESNGNRWFATLSFYNKEDRREPSSSAGLIPVWPVTY